MISKTVDFNITAQNTDDLKFLAMRHFNFFADGYLQDTYNPFYYVATNSKFDYGCGSVIRCSNGIQDQNETGVDCGPICNKSCNPDLSVKISSISELLDEENATINITVSELNNISVNPTVELRIDGISTDTETISLQGSLQNMTFYWLANSGIHNISVVVDPLNEINETDEMNNIDWELVNVTVLPDLALNTEDIALWIF